MYDFIGSINACIDGQIIGRRMGRNIAIRRENDRIAWEEHQREKENRRQAFVDNWRRANGFPVESDNAWKDDAQARQSEIDRLRNEIWSGEHQLSAAKAEIRTKCTELNEIYGGLMHLVDELEHRYLTEIVAEQTVAKSKPMSSKDIVAAKNRATELAAIDVVNIVGGRGFWFRVRSTSKDYEQRRADLNEKIGDLFEQKEKRGIDKVTLEYWLKRILNSAAGGYLEWKIK